MPWKVLHLKNLLWGFKHVLCALYRVLTKKLLIPIIMRVVYDNIGWYFSLHLSFVLIWSIIYLGCRWSDYLFPSNTGNSCKIHSVSWTPHFQGPEQNVAYNYETQKMTVVKLIQNAWYCHQLDNLAIYIDT